MTKINDIKDIGATRSIFKPSQRVLMLAQYASNINLEDSTMTAPNGDLTPYLPHDLQTPLPELPIHALDRHRRLASVVLDDTAREENDLLDRALCQRIDDIDLELLRHVSTVKGQEEHRIVLGALERIQASAHLTQDAVGQMVEDMRNAA